MELQRESLIISEYVLLTFTDGLHSLASLTWE